MNAPESTLFNAVPVVSELNRVAGFDPLRFLKKTANGHELDLRYKKRWFRLKYPAGRTRLTPLRITDQLAIIEAKVFFDKDDADPASSYIATMTQENAPAGLYIQDAEHDALDMALTNAGFGVQFAPMPKVDTSYAEQTTPVMEAEPAPAPQAAAEQVRTEPAAVQADVEPVVVQQPEQEVVHHGEEVVPDAAPLEVSGEQPVEAIAEPAVETELPFVYDEPNVASYTKDMDVDTICALMTEAEAVSSANKNYGEAQLVSVANHSGSKFFEEARLKRTKAHDEAMDAVQKALKSSSLSAEEKKSYTQQLTGNLEDLHAENEIETMVKAKGFADCLCFLQSGRADLTVMTSGDALTAAQVAQIRDIVLSKSSVTAQNITIVEVK